MKGLGYILLLTFGGYAAFKFYENQKKIEVDLSNRAVAPPGISYYQPIAVTSRIQQLQAFNPDGAPDSTVSGYSPAFGPNENQPSPGQEIFF